MPVELNHTIINSQDPEAAAAWYAEVLGLDAPERFGHFWQVVTSNRVSLDFDHASERRPPQHYAFLISEPEFDAIFGRIVAQGLDYFADPAGRHPGEINHHDGGRGVYFPDPDGNWLEIITRPYGSGS